LPCNYRKKFENKKFISRGGVRGPSSPDGFNMEKFSNFQKLQNMMHSENIGPGTCSALHLREEKRVPGHPGAEPGAPDAGRNMV
jgi:hypothetical protein